MGMGYLEPGLLIGAGSFLGGVIAGFFGGKRAGQEIPEGVAVEKSAKTGGAFHVSEEGLAKIKELDTRLKADYLTEDKHTDLCLSKQLEMKLHIASLLNVHTKEILAAIKKNGNGHSSGPPGKDEGGDAWTP